MCVLCIAIDKENMKPFEIARAYKEILDARDEHDEEIFNKLEEKGLLDEVLNELGEGGLDSD